MLARPLSVTTIWPACCWNACIATVNAPPLLARDDDVVGVASSRQLQDEVERARVPGRGLVRRVRRAAASRTSGRTRPTPRTAGRRGAPASALERRVGVGRERRGRRAGGPSPARLGRCRPARRGRGANSCQLKPVCCRPEARAERDDEVGLLRAGCWPSAGPTCSGRPKYSGSSAPRRSTPFHVVMSGTPQLASARSQLGARPRATRRRRAAAPAAREPSDQRRRSIAPRRPRPSAPRRSAPARARRRPALELGRRRPARPARRGTAR